MKKDQTFVPVFVYGTLKEGFPLNDYWMKGAKKVGHDSLTGYMLVTFGTYPIMGKLHGKHEETCVLGEVWQVPADKYREVKSMEEAAGYRTEDVVTDTGQTCKAFVFFDVVSGAYSWQHGEDKGHSMRAPVGRVAVNKLDDLPF